MIVGRFEANPMAGDALDQPVSFSIVGLPVTMSGTDRPLHIRSPEASLVEAQQGVSSPHEVFNGHGRRESMWPPCIASMIDAEGRSPQRWRLVVLLVGTRRGGEG